MQRLKDRKEQMYKRIAVVMSETSESLSAAKHACELACVHGSESVALVAVVSERRFLKINRKEAEEQAALSTKCISPAMEVFDAASISNEVVLLNGDPADEIGRYAFCSGIELVVVGSKYFDKVVRGVRGMKGSPEDRELGCPVMIVKCTPHDGAAGRAAATGVRASAKADASKPATADAVKSARGSAAKAAGEE